MALAQGEGHSESNVPAGPLEPVGGRAWNADHYKCGYLQKKTKSGQWQRRWFETNGVFLTYYKNKKMAKLLAAVNLPQVGEIAVIEPDAENDDTVEGGCFSTQLNSREYILKATDEAEAQAWVEVLTKLKTDAPLKQQGANYETESKSASTTPVESTKQASGTAGDIQKTSRGLFNGGCCPRFIYPFR
eukprot:FR740035.1.p1 GENE.FR740035.1~~FR740035.1.p1  ORF type:complete len:209 (+),score=6.41 FR740035.1:66-629(+)